jgi:phosphatidate cytidylyltransferase
MRSPNTAGANAVSVASLRAPDRDVVTEPGSASPVAIGELGKRVLSGIVLAALAIGTAVFGGWTFVLLWTVAALGVFWEWWAMARGATVASSNVAMLAVGAVALLLVAAAAGSGAFAIALVPLAAGAIAAGVLAAPGQRAWGAAGVLYSGTVVLAPVLLRRDGELGLIAILFLFAVVWATDILGYVVGRAIGGPKLAARISPNKTWSGTCGGALAAVAAGVAVMAGAGAGAVMATACVALVLSIVSQAGDLIESAIKRRFGVKDASHVIPGHGGLMDRLDGFLAATGVAALVGLARGGVDACARGFLLW